VPTGPERFDRSIQAAHDVFARESIRNRADLALLFAHAKQLVRRHDDSGVEDAGFRVLSI
jgi:hypothetical protein